MLTKINSIIDNYTQEFSAQIASKYNLDVNELNQLWKTIVGQGTSNGLTRPSRRVKAQGATGNVAPKPKKISAYIQYSKLTRSEVKQEFPTMKPTDVTKEIARRWRLLTIEEKNKYKDDDVPIVEVVLPVLSPSLEILKEKNNDSSDGDDSSDDEDNSSDVDSSDDEDDSSDDSIDNKDEKNDKDENDDNSSDDNSLDDKDEKNDIDDKKYDLDDDDLNSYNNSVTKDEEKDDLDDDDLNSYSESVTKDGEKDDLDDDDLNSYSESVTKDEEKEKKDDSDYFPSESEDEDSSYDSKKKEFNKSSQVDDLHTLVLRSKNIKKRPENRLNISSPIMTRVNDDEYYLPNLDMFDSDSSPQLKTKKVDLSKKKKEVQSVDYTKMKKEELIELCKEKKIDVLGLKYKQQYIEKLQSNTL